MASKIKMCTFFEQKSAYFDFFIKKYLIFQNVIYMSIFYTVVYQFYTLTNP
jgi:hypothetical protein